MPIRPTSRATTSQPTPPVALSPARVSQLKAAVKAVGNLSWNDPRTMGAISSAVKASSVSLPIGKYSVGGEWGTATVVVPVGPQDPNGVTDPNKAGTFYISFAGGRGAPSAELGPFGLNKKGLLCPTQMDVATAFAVDLRTTTEAFIRSIAWGSDDPAEKKRLDAGEARMLKQFALFEKTNKPLTPDVQRLLAALKARLEKQFHPGPDIGYGPNGPADPGFNPGGTATIGWPGHDKFP